MVVLRFSAVHGYTNRQPINQCMIILQELTGHEEVASLNSVTEGEQNMVAFPPAKLWRTNRG
jgi:hypothetical protein